MPCYHPITGYRSRTLNESGKRSIVFKATDGFIDLPVTIPCGRCIGCKLERSRQWAIRCMHEASLHEDNSFITLTYNNKYLPADGSLNKKHFQDFIKRLRKSLPEKKIRYFHCGEYGPENWRPHYHACLFGHDFVPKTHWQTNNNQKLYISPELQKLWHYGFSSIGTVTFDSAAYVARYIMKKITGDKAQKHYEHVDTETGEVTQLLPEYTTMSRNPGIGRGWYDKYKSEVYPSDFIVIRGVKMKPPKFYEKMYELEEEDDHLDLKKNRTTLARRRAGDNTTARLRTREDVKRAQLKQLPRKL